MYCTLIISRLQYTVYYTKLQYILLTYRTCFHSRNDNDYDMIFDRPVPTPTHHKNTKLSVELVRIYLLEHILYQIPFMCEVKNVFKGLKYV